MKILLRLKKQLFLLERNEEDKMYRIPLVSFFIENQISMVHSVHNMKRIEEKNVRKLRVFERFIFSLFKVEEIFILYIMKFKYVVQMRRNCVFIYYKMKI
jgi:hypothetical protein